MLHLAFDLVDAIDVELHVPGFPDRLGGVGGHHAQLGQLVGGVGSISNQMRYFDWGDQMSAISGRV